MTPEVRARWMSTRIKHGGYLNGRESSTHAIWRGMIARCHNRNSQDYYQYGARGIKVCRRWHKFENFLADMGERPIGLQLERSDNNKGYSPKNCRWATHTEQQRNKRNNVLFRQGSDVGTLSYWAQTLGISMQLAHWRWRHWGTFIKGETWQHQNPK